MQPDEPTLADELAADRGANRSLDARVAVALYRDGGHADPRDNTHARLPSKSDDCAPGTYWISAFSGLSLRTAPDYTSDPTLKRLALAALQAQRSGRDAAQAYLDDPRHCDTREVRLSARDIMDEHFGRALNGGPDAA